MHLAGICRAGIVVVTMRLWIAIVFLLACTSEEVRRPEESLTLFLDLLERSRGDELALRDAYGLLADESRAGLTQRAQRAKTLSGGDYEPWQMLVSGSFRLKMPIAERGGMRSQVEGERALVTVHGTRGQLVTVPMLWQRGGWRVLLKLPRIPGADAFGTLSP